VIISTTVGSHEMFSWPGAGRRPATRAALVPFALRILLRLRARMDCFLFFVSGRCSFVPEPDMETTLILFVRHRVSLSSPVIIAVRVTTTPRFGD